jgi:hypothetical protein
MTIEIPVGAPGATALAQPAAPDMELTSSGKFAIWASIISVLFLSQVAYNIGTFPLSGDLICYALVALYLLTTGHASIGFVSFALFIVALAMACFGTLATASAISWPSLLLLFVLYAPFSVRMKGQTGAVHQYILYAFVSAATVIAGVAVVQIILVNALKLSFLTNIYFVLPEAIRGAGFYTFSREGGGIVKANGFFLRESAELSIVIIIEYTTRARWRTLTILGVGFVSSFSGSGIFALAVGLLMPRSLVRIPLFFVSCLGLLMALFLLYSLELPFLDIWFGRLSEFQTPNTSAYARFVAPMEMVARSFGDGAVTTLLGNGGGSYLRSIVQLRSKYEVNDPTWAKLIFEYGLAGFFLVSAIFMGRLYSSRLRVEVSNYILFSWMSVGLVQKPGFALIVWLLTMVPQSRR